MAENYSASRLLSFGFLISIVGISCFQWGLLFGQRSKQVKENRRQDPRLLAVMTTDSILGQHAEIPDPSIRQHSPSFDRLHNPKAEISLQRSVEQSSAVEHSGFEANETGNKSLPPDAQARKSTAAQVCEHHTGDASVILDTVQVKSRSTYNMSIYHARDIVSETLRKGDLWEPKILFAIKQKMEMHGEGGALMIDVGANVGFYTSFLASEGHRVIAFEPFGFNMQALMSTVCSNPDIQGRVRVFKSALLDKEGGAMCLWSTSTDTNNGNARLTPEFEGRQDFDANKGVSCMERIESHTLDAMLFMPEHGIRLTERAMVMKMDIEGSETRALLGASKLLSPALAPCFIFFEFQRTPTETTGVDRHLIFDTLSAAGYLVYDCLDTERRAAYTRARWGRLNIGDLRADLHRPEAASVCQHAK